MNATAAASALGPIRSRDDGRVSDDRHRRRRPAGADLPPLRSVVPDLVPEGTTILASPPKVGKSCLVYQIAVEAALGGELLGRRVTPGSVLYLALEDGQRRGQDRLRAALAGRTMPRGRLEVRWSAPAIGNGLEDELGLVAGRATPTPRWSRSTPSARYARSNGKRDAYEIDVEDLARLQTLFKNRTVALLIVHHSRKEATTTSWPASRAPTASRAPRTRSSVIRRNRLEAFGTVLVTGRDVADAEIPVRFDGLTWHERRRSCRRHRSSAARCTGSSRPRARSSPRRSPTGSAAADERPADGRCPREERRDRTHRPPATSSRRR